MQLSKGLFPAASDLAESSSAKQSELLKRASTEASSRGKLAKLDEDLPHGYRGRKTARGMQLGMLWLVNSN